MSLVIIEVFKTWEMLVGTSVVLTTLLLLWSQISKISSAVIARARAVKSIMDTPRKVKELEEYRLRVETSLDSLTRNGNQVSTALEAVSKQISDIALEFKPNGGSSLRDAVNKLALQQYIDNESRRKLMEADGLAFWESDMGGGAIYLSEALLDIIGLDSRDALGTGWASCLAPEDRDRVIHEWEDDVKSQRKFIQTYTFITPGGVRTKVQANSTPLIKNSVVVGFIGVITKLNAISSTS